LFKKFTTAVFIVVFIFTCITAIEYCKPKDREADLPVQKANAIVGDQQCKSCHNNEFKDWQLSDHFKAMQKPDDSTVLGNFNNATLTADGISSKFFKKDGKFYINTQGDDGSNHDYEVKYTFGYFPLQQYLIEFPGGKMQATRQSWDSREKKWFHQYPGQKIHYRDWLHWTGNAQNWNTMCAECHSTNLQKGYDVQMDTYNTTYDVLTVSCESCHGPGKNHIDYTNSESYKKGEKVVHSYIKLGKNSGQMAQINTCMPCHAVQNGLDANKLNSSELMDDYVPMVPTTVRYFADGQIKEEDYNYASFLQSKMFTRGIACGNCHNVHSGKLVLAGNKTCMQCHTPGYDAPTHTNHAINSAGSECKNCHAPGKLYMVNDLRHDHSFRVPRPDLSVKYGTPNACNNCHTTKSAQWATDAVIKWFGPQRKYHFAEDLIPGSMADDKSEAHLDKLIGDTAVPNIIKATAASYLGDILTQSSKKTLLGLLKDKDPMIRYESLRSLMHFGDAINETSEVADLLKDNVRAVRIAAADLVQLVGTQSLSEEQLADLQKAKGELERNLLYQADFAHGNIAIADYYQRTKNFSSAETFYLRALKKDSLANLARLNLASTYNMQGKNNEALTVLKTAVLTDPKNEQGWYNLGLLYNEMKDFPNAGNAFEKAVQLNSENARLYYNYGLFLQQSGNTEKAISVLQKGLKISPSDEELNYAMAYILMSTNQPAKALPYASLLKKINPGNPDYRQLFTTLGL
jgi:tetratricopeptide (TPR) repeat protein